MIFLVASYTLSLFLLGGASIGAAISFRRQKSQSQGEEPSIQVLIPCHNEEARIEITLAALAREFSTLKITPTIHIALDACTDQTEAVIQRSMRGLSIQISKVQNRSKWRTLSHLVSEVTADRNWIVILDAGVDFEPGLFLHFEKLMKNSSLSYLCPAYRVQGGSKLANLFWMFESAIKSVENSAGGSISVHGAAIAYRKMVVQKLFQKFRSEKSEFKNDDVMIPMASRIEFPQLMGHYFTTPKVFDHAFADRFSFATQLNQRKRMVIGNLEWMRWLRRQDHVPAVVTALSIRRALRPFWVYLLILITWATYLEVGVFALILLLPMLLFRAATLASFYAAYAWLFKKDQQQSAWK
jgi:hypothetical protein